MTVRLVLAAAIFGWLGGAAQADTYPTRAVTMVVGQNRRAPQRTQRVTLRRLARSPIECAGSPIRHARCCTSGGP